MGHVFKPTWTVRLPDGRTAKRRSRRWHVRWIDAQGRRRSRVAYTDKAASQALLTQLEREAEREAAGLAVPEAKTMTGPVGPLFEAFEASLAARMLRPDLEAAGIPFETETGRFDFHSLRVQYASGLARAGVPLQTAQKLMRHSTPTLTANIYTRLDLIDLGGAVQAIPAPAGAKDVSKRRAETG